MSEVRARAYQAWWVREREREGWSDVWPVRVHAKRLECTRKAARSARAVCGASARALGQAGEGERARESWSEAWPVPMRAKRQECTRQAARSARAPHN